MRLILGFVLAVTGGAAIAEPFCRTGSRDVVQLVSWEVGGPAAIREYTEINLEFLVNTDQQPIAIAGTVTFYDPLDRKIEDSSLPGIPEFHDFPSLQGTAWWISASVESVGRLGSENVTVLVCTTRVAYADGTVEDF